MSDADNVRVAVRMRPLSQGERERGCVEQVLRTPNAPQVTVVNADSFTFNYVFDATEAQEKLYTDCVLEMLDGLFNGFNATILAYGQTGSGKTYTMGTAFDGELREDTGVIPRAMVDLFRRMDNLSDKYDFSVTCSFMELYQEQLYDLLSCQSREQSVVELREDRNGNVITSSLTEEQVKTVRDTTDCLMRGSKGRAVGCTAMNQHSSRSHAIFTVTIKATPKNDMGIATTSKFRLVDLAGSERSKKTKATGDRFKEGVKINQGLLALGNVISALGSANQGSGFVKYRDSKLTRLLQDSLGGNSITLMIACISPADYNIQETLSTLRYADRARRIKNKPVVNNDPISNKVKLLNSIIRDLYARLVEAGGTVPDELASNLKHIVEGAAPSSNVASLAEPCENMYHELKEKYNELQKQLRTAVQDLTDKEVRAHAVEAACEKAKSKTHDIMITLNALRCDLTSDVTSEILDEHNNQIQCVKDTVIQLNNELEQMQIEIDSNPHEMPYDGGDEPHEVCEFIQEEEDDYTKKQMKYKQELQNIKAELNLKNELRRRVEGNLHKLNNIDANLLEKFKESENKIKSLESEKAELEEKLNQKIKDNASAKLAETRRQRLQHLEQELHKIKIEKSQQEKLLKQCKGERERVKHLSNEIQKMKESKVKLIRTMRQESEYFRQWKFMREKELAQLKNKDRKLQNEMARKEAYHTSRYNILTRKLQEARAAKKRYLERDMAVQKMRLAIYSQKGQINLERLISLIEQDFVVITSLVDMENSLKHLTDDRISLNNRIKELEELQSTEKDTAACQELESMKKELELRNSQIADIEEKIGGVDKNVRIHVICENIVKVGDPREAIRRLLLAMLNNHMHNVRELFELKMKCDELQNQLKTADDRCNQVNEQIRAVEMEHEKRSLERENAYEEKISVLLRQLHNKATQLYNNAEMTTEQQECIRIREEQLSKMESMQEELEEYREMVKTMRNACMAKQNKKNQSQSQNAVDVNAIDVDAIDDLISDIEEESDLCDDDDDADDPDWQKTPIARKRSKTSHRTLSSESGNLGDTFVTAGSTVNTTYFLEPGTTVVPKTEQSKRKRGGSRCYCRGSCSNNRCGCYASSEKCAKGCRCGEACVNGKVIGDSSDGSKDSSSNDSVMMEKLEMVVDENEVTSPLKKMKEKTDSMMFAANDSKFITPKIARMSTISFESASARKKFFE